MSGLALVWTFRDVMAAVTVGMWLLIWALVGIVALAHWLDERRDRKR